MLEMSSLARRRGRKYGISLRTMGSRVIGTTAELLSNFVYGVELMAR